MVRPCIVTPDALPEHYTVKIGSYPAPAVETDASRQLHLGQHAGRLDRALRNGDLSTAKFAFVKLRQSAMCLAPAQGKPMEQPLSEMADALLSGNVETASKMFQTLQAAMVRGGKGPAPAAQSMTAAALPPSNVTEMPPGLGTAVNIVV